MTKARYLQLKQQRRELHAELKRFKKFYVNSLKIPNRERKYMHDIIIANFKSARREYKLVTELLHTQKELLKITRSNLNLRLLVYPI